MATTKIRLSVWNSKGALACIEDTDGDSVDIALSKTTKSAKTICKRAAERLRQLAAKFEALAETEEPFKFVTQEQINRTSC